mgnify:FL=1|tara:strand:+ start:1088 stop:1300 length:213 start_codon:yes stop_codon:yes gene_type:complete
MSEDKEELSNEIVELLKNDPFFIQALKDFESLGFLKISDERIQIVDRDGLQKYMDDFGKHQFFNNQKEKS